MNDYQHAYKWLLMCIWVATAWEGQRGMGRGGDHRCLVVDHVEEA